MELITGESTFLRSFQCLAAVGMVIAGLSGCAAPSTSTDSYELVLDAPGLETVQPEVVAIRDNYAQIIDRTTWNASHATWPQAQLVFLRLRDFIRKNVSYIREKSLPEFIEASFPGENITLGADGRTKNVLGDLDFQRFRRSQIAECIFIEQAISRLSDTDEVIGSGESLGDMVVRGWYCVAPTEPNQDAAFQGFIDGIGIRGWTLSGERKTSSSGAFPYAVVFTSLVFKTSDGQELADEFDEVSLDHGRVYVYVKWRGLTKESHLAQLRVFDGAGKQVGTSDYEFTPTSTRWYTWLNYYIDPDVDQPGSWRFEMGLDGETLVERSLIVTPSAYGSARSGITETSRDAAFRVYQVYDEAFKYKVFVRNGDGAWAWRVREAFYSAQGEALQACHKRSKADGQPGECRVYAAGDDVVWDMSEKERQDAIKAYKE